MKNLIDRLKGSMLMLVPYIFIFVPLSLLGWFFLGSYFFLILKIIGFIIGILVIGSFISDFIEKKINYVGYVVGIYPLLMAFGSFAGAYNSIFASCLFFLAGILCFPPIIRWVNIDFLTKYNFIFVGVFFVLAILNTNNKLYYKMESHTRGEDGKVVKSETNYLLKLFNSPQELCSILSNNEIGKLSEWKALNAGTNLFSSSSSFQIDSQENEDSIKNIISYLILGNKNLVKELNIIMDINNEKQRNYGLNFLISITEKTLISLNLDLDKSIKNDISNAIKSPRKFKFENESFVISIDNRWDKTRNNIKIENYYLKFRSC